MVSGGDGDGLSLARAFEGRTFGGYRIARALASGGMATVFLARKTGPGRFAQTAALKVIHPHLATEREFVEMFLEEARIASSINHPNVCRVLDFGQAEGTFFLAMEYLRGETWATTLEALTAQRESRDRVHVLSAHVIAQACEGLHAVHEAVDASGRPLDIVHRDVSPQNLLVAYDGSVRVLDFGIASARDKSQGSTTQVIKGRYAYMAPEQVRGLEVDRRADIWSLGVVLREALTGERLFERDTQVATILAVTKDPFPPWPQRVPWLLREICDRALERDPAARYASARELGSALVRYLTNELEPASSAELARWMRGAFSKQIAQKRAELRELAGDETQSGQISSIIPLPAADGAPASAPTQPPPRVSYSQTPGTGVGTRRRKRRLLRWMATAMLGFGVAATGAWRLAQPAAPAPGATQRGEVAYPGPAAARAQPALAAPPRLAEVAAPVTERPASKPLSAAPGRPEPADPSAQAGAKDTGAAARGSAPDSSEDEERAERRSHRRHRGDETAAAPSAAATAAQGPGTLMIGATRGWAEVFFEGQRLGTTPLRTELMGGERELEVRFYGTGTARRVRVHVKPGEVTKLRLEQ